jgi:hypothetical protein
MIDYYVTGRFAACKRSLARFKNTLRSPSTDSLETESRETIPLEDESKQDRADFETGETVPTAGTQAPERMDR